MFLLVHFRDFIMAQGVCLRSCTAMCGGGNLSSLSREPSSVGHCRVSARSVVRPRLLPRRRLLSAHRESGQVQTIFNDIADDYDLLNDALSLGLHRSWKRAAVQWTRAKKGQRALDACTGTGDIAALLATAVGAEGHVVGLDFAPEILDVARRRAAPRAAAGHVISKAGVRQREDEPVAPRTARRARARPDHRAAGDGCKLSGRSLGRTHPV